MDSRTILTHFKGKFSSLLSIFNKVTNIEETCRSLKEEIFLSYSFRQDGLSHKILVSKEGSVSKLKHIKVIFIISLAPNNTLVLLGSEAKVLQIRNGNFSKHRAKSSITLLYRNTAILRREIERERSNLLV